MTERIRVLVLFGGRSAEHDVSRASAVTVAAALDPERYEVVPVAITKDGHWLLAGEARAALEGARDELPPAFRVEGPAVVGLPDPGSRALVPIDASAPNAPAPTAFDVVLPLLHGPYGEDGTVQGLFELAGMPYVGSGVVGSAAAMDKVLMKHAFEAVGLAMARWLSFRDGHDRGAFEAQVADELGFPCFVKPANLGSSVGVSKAHDARELASAPRPRAPVRRVGRRRRSDRRSRDRSRDPRRRPTRGVGSRARSFRARSSTPTPTSTKTTPRSCSRPLRSSLSRRTMCRRSRFGPSRRVAARRWRVDFLLEEHAPGGGPGRGFLINEVNTIPGFTPISMYPRLWAESGVPYSELLDRLIELALARHERRQRRAGQQRQIEE